MTIMQQPSLFSIQELYDIQPTEKYDAIVAAINLDIIHYEVMKNRIVAHLKNSIIRL